MSVYSLPLFSHAGAKRTASTLLQTTTDHAVSAAVRSSLTCEKTHYPVTHVSVRRQRVVGVEEDNRLWAKFPDHRNKSLLFCSGGTLCVCFHHDWDGTCVNHLCVIYLCIAFSQVCVCVCVRVLSV